MQTEIDTSKPTSTTIKAAFTYPSVHNDAMVEELPVIPSESSAHGGHEPPQSFPVSMLFCTPSLQLDNAPGRYTHRYPSADDDDRTDTNDLLHV